MSYVALRTLLIASGLLWGSTYFVMNAVGWGEPGTAAYERYELLNRILALVLIALCVTTVALRIALKPHAPSYVSRALIAMAIGLAIMILGSALEFWIFTVTPYAPGSLRGIGWGTYCLGLLTFYLAGTPFGFWLIRSRTSSLAGIAFLGWLPLVGILFAAGRLLGRDIPALAPAVALSGLAFVILGLQKAAR